MIIFGIIIWTLFLGISLLLVVDMILNQLQFGFVNNNILGFLFGLSFGMVLFFNMWLYKEEIIKFLSNLLAYIF